jgi:tetratricopeptide (TPR) repeat protein
VEHPELLETGSINDIKKRLLLWAKRSPKGLARVEFSSEFSRQKVLDEIRKALAEAEIKLHEIVLPSQQEAIVVVEKLVEELNQIESGLVSITGFPTAFTNKIPLEESIRIFNFHRDRLVAPNLNQIWWMTPAFLQTSIHAMPDINSWFSMRLHLQEMLLMEVNPEQHLAIIDPSVGLSTNIDDARRRVHNLLERFQQGQLTGTPDLELLTTYLLPALGELANVGAQKELRDLTLQFEWHLGQLENSPDLENSLDRLAGIYHSQGLYIEAKILYLKVLESRKRQFGVDHPSVANSASNLANTYRYQLRYNEAESLYLQALEIWSKLESDDFNFAVTLNNLGLVYTSQGKFSKAELLYFYIVNYLSEDNPSLGVSLSRLAELYCLQGRYSEAEPLYLRSLCTIERQFGKEHPNVAAILNNLSVLYSFQGRYSEAESISLNAFNILEKQLGTEHPYAIKSLNNLAIIYANMKRFPEAENLLVKALELRKKVLGDEHPDTMRTQKSLANVRAKMI